jgi:hypothetical protein
MDSKKYELNKEDLKKIAMSMVYSGAAAMLVIFMAALEQIDLPAVYMSFIPVINAMLYSVVKFLQGRV